MKKRSLYFFVLMLLCVIAKAEEIRTTTKTVLMVPPDGFKYNEQTAKSNAYQQKIKDADFLEKAHKEFYLMVAKLRSNGVKVIILPQASTLPDAIFPNNWFSTHLDNNGKTTIILYPMLTTNRQQEVNLEGLKKALKKNNITIHKVQDLRKNNTGVLEGTGSMVFDRKNHIIYASLSPRTTRHMINKVATFLSYRPVIFTSVDRENKAIYHTNVMMGLTDHYAVVCLECITDLNQRNDVINHLKQADKIVIPITQNQVSNLCGNIIELTNNNAESILVMSKKAYNNFTEPQLKKIQYYSKILPMNLNTIETIGGGSARCMIAEIFHKN